MGIKTDREILCLDVETTGVDPVQDRIIEIGFSVIHPDGTVKPKGWSRRFNPGIPIPEESTKIHGITDADVKDCLPFSSIAPTLHARMLGKDLLTYNGRMLDLTILDEEFRRCNLKLDLTGIRIIDASVIFRKREERTLAAAVTKYTGKTHDGAHGAGADAQATVEVLFGQLEHYPELREMDMDALSQYCLYDDKRPADIAGKLYYDANGDMRYGFGKVRDKRVQDDTGFGFWMLRQNFPANTREVLDDYLNRE